MEIFTPRKKNPFGQLCCFGSSAAADPQLIRLFIQGYQAKLIHLFTVPLVALLFSNPPLKNGAAAAAPTSCLPFVQIPQLSVLLGVPFAFTGSLGCLNPAAATVSLASVSLENERVACPIWSFAFTAPKRIHALAP